MKLAWGAVVDISLAVGIFRWSLLVVNVIFVSVDGLMALNSLINFLPFIENDHWQVLQCHILSRNDF